MTRLVLTGWHWRALLLGLSTVGFAHAQQAPLEDSALAADSPTSEAAEAPALPPPSAASAEGQPPPPLAPDATESDAKPSASRQNRVQDSQTSTADMQPAAPDAADTEDPEALLAELDDALAQDEVAGPGPNLHLYGFSDFSFYKYFLHENALINGIIYRETAFAVGNLNVYLAGDLAESWESLAEVRFTYLPNGSRRIDSTGVQRTDTGAADYTNLGRVRRLGGLFVERVWLQYNADPLLSIRGGSWLTPYGIWNVDHGSPTIIPVMRPYMIGLELLPERQTGLLVRGTGYPSEHLSLGYALGLSNGRGPVQDYADLDANKATTLRLHGVLRTTGVLELGGFGYYGRYTDIEQSLQADGAGFQVVDELVEQYDELALGLDVKYTLGGFHGQAEFITSQRKYTEQGRLQRTATTYYPDDTRIGGYGVLGYRFDWFGVMPYATGEYFRFMNTLEPNLPATQIVAVVGALGLNSRPTPTVTLKLEGSYGTFRGDIPEGSTFAHSLWALQSQAAWAF